MKLDQRVSSERFIPFRRDDVITMVTKHGGLAESEIPAFVQLCRLLTATFHYEFQHQLETLKNNYTPFNPDLDTRALRALSEQELQRAEEALVDALTELLQKANFERITDRHLQEALHEESLFKIRLQVNFSDFEQVLFFRRGESRRHETLRQWGGLRTRRIEFTNYERVVVFLKFRDQAHFDAQKRKNLFFKPGSTVIKLFRNVPKADLEMLFPNTEVRMKPIDKVILGVPAAVGGAAMVFTKLGTTLLLIGSLGAFYLGLRREPVVLDQAALLALAAGFGAVGAFLWKHVNKFKERKIRFMKTLAENLYFKNLDNNAGVLHHLIDAAEEDECKEAILGYYFLLVARTPLSAQALDRAIEAWFAERWGTRLDFEISDALGKLSRLELVRDQGGLYSPKCLSEALVTLDEAWDRVFDYRAPDATATPPFAQ